MRRLVVSAAVSMAVVMGGVVAAQKIATADDYSKVMKTTATAFQGTFKAVGSGAAADAKTQLATARQGFMTLQTFWMEKGKADAVTLVKDALTQLDAADKALSAATPDTMAAQAALKQAQQSCGGCHKLYRDGDGKATPYSFKPGVL